MFLSLANCVNWRLRQGHKGDCIFPWVRRLPFSVKWLEASPSVAGLIVAASERWSFANVVGSVQNKRNFLIWNLSGIIYDDKFDGPCLLSFKSILRCSFIRWLVLTALCRNTTSVRCTRRQWEERGMSIWREGTNSLEKITKRIFSMKGRVLGLTPTEWLWNDSVQSCTPISNYKSHFLW